MPRAESKHKSEAYDRSGLPWGVQKALCTGVEVTLEEEKFPERKQGKGIDMIVKMNFLPAGHIYPVSATYDLRIRVDEDNMIIVDDNKDTPMDERVNVGTFHETLAKIGYIGGFATNTAWCDLNDKEINYEDIEMELNTFIADVKPELYVFVEKYRDKDGAVKNSITPWGMKENNQAGLRAANRTYANKTAAIKALFETNNGPPVLDTSSPTPTPSPVKPGKRF